MTLVLVGIWMYNVMCVAGVACPYIVPACYYLPYYKQTVGIWALGRQGIVHDRSALIL